MRFVLGKDTRRYWPHIGEQHDGSTRLCTVLVQTRTLNSRTDTDISPRYMTPEPVALCTIHVRYGVIPQRMGAAADRVRVAASAF